MTHRGRIEVVEAKLYSRPATAVPLFGAAMTKRTSALAGQWADGLLLGGHSGEAVRPLVDAFREAGGDGKPVHVQMAVSWAPEMATAEANAVEQWASASVGGEASWDLRRPADFDEASRLATADTLRDGMVITDSLSQIGDVLGEIAALGVAAIHLHMVGANQEQFIDEIGTRRLLAMQ